jgi:transposase-like protein
MNLIKFQQQFKDEKACIEWLATQRWGGMDKAVCPHCGAKDCYTYSNGKMFKCSECLKQFTVKIGTVFEDSRLPLVKWFLAIYLFTSLKKGISSIQLSKYIDVTQKTAWFMLGRIREVMNGGGDSGMFKGVTEIDEVYLGGKEAKKHKNKKGKSEKTMVFGMVNRDTKQVKAMKIASTKTEDLQEVIYSNVEEGSTILTDSYAGYDVLKWNYTHDSVKHCTREYVKRNSRLAFKMHTNTIEGVLSLLKRGIIGIYHWVSAKHVNKYLSEFTLGYNKKDQTDFERFGNWFSGFEAKRLTYVSLIG